MRSSDLPEGLGPLLDAPQLVERADGEAVVVHAGAPHRVVLGDEEDELVPVDAAQDEPAPVLGHDLHLVKPSTSSKKRHTSARLVASRRSAGSDMATWLKRGLPARVEGVRHQADLGTTMTLPAMRPAARSSSASPMPSSGDVVGIDQQVGREAVGRQQLERPLEAALVVDERPGHGQLVEDHAVDVEGGVVDAGTDHDQDAAAGQLAEPGLDGGPVPRALEHDVDGARRHAARAPRTGRPRGRRGRRAAVTPRSAASRRRPSCGSTTVMSVDPHGLERGHARARRSGRRRRP